MAAWEDDIEAELEAELEHAQDRSSQHRIMAVIVLGAAVLAANALIILSGRADSLYSLIQF